MMCCYLSKRKKKNGRVGRLVSGKGEEGGRYVGPTLKKRKEKEKGKGKVKVR